MNAHRDPKLTEMCKQGTDQNKYLGGVYMR